MKSYQEHLSSLLSSKPTSICNQSSAIFPLFYNPECKTKLLFFNYWKLKRKIDHLLCRLYLRDQEGQLIFKKCFFVDEIRSYEIDLSRLLSIHYPFLGSIEIEFSSPSNLVFPFPAVVVTYEGKNFLTYVHSSQRIIKDKKGKESKSKNKIIESGFNIYASKEVNPFLTFVNGPCEIKNKEIKLFAYNFLQKKLDKTLHISSKPYQTHYLSLKDWKELPDHLQNKPGCLKAELFSSQTFPRLIVGNYDEKRHSMSVTHSYYDLSHSKKEADYWVYDSKNWHAQSLSLPLAIDAQLDSKIYFYPIYSPAHFYIDAEIYDKSGKLLKQIENVIEIEDKPSFQTLNASELTLGLSSKDSLMIKLIARAHLEGKIPTRIKVGLDLGFKKGGFPCNICTNFSPANPSLETKPSAFRWAPMLPSKYQGWITCINDCPQKNYQKKAQVECTFYRLKDTLTISQTYTLPPHGHLNLKHTQKTKEFFEDEIGWCVLKSDNPYLSTYYFSKHPQKMVGGDHGF